VTFTFSEAPITFTLFDTSTIGGTLSNLQQVNATSYTATFTATPDTDISNALVSVSAGSWQEGNGNLGQGGSTSLFTVDTTAPTVTSVSATTDNQASTAGAGHLVTITLHVNEVAVVTGAPKLQLSDNEVAVYSGGSGSDALTFGYTVQPADNTPDLHVTGLSLPNGAGIADPAGNALTGAVTGDLHLQVFTPLTMSQIDEVYQAVLQRLPTPAEVNAGASEAGATTIATVVNSTEAEFNVYPAIQIIDLALGVDPTAHQLAGWVPFVESAGPLQGQSQTNPVLDQMAEAFVASDAFGKVYNNGTDVDPNSLVTVHELQVIIQAATGVASTPAQVAAWLSTGLTIDQVFVDFALGDHYTAISKTTNQEFLTAAADNAAGLQPPAAIVGIADVNLSSVTHG
jgi:hypothetical protein